MFEYLTLSAELLARIDNEYPPQQRRAVRQLLRKYGRGPGEENVEAVRNTILDYAQGCLQVVDELVKQAREEPTLLTA